MKKPTKDDLFWYLDIFNFVWEFEILGAIEDFFRECVEKDENRTPSYGELVYFQDLAKEYMDKKQLVRDTEWIIDEYENKMAQYTI